MADVNYTKQHEWARLDGEIATVGISDYAQEQLGDVVYVELPETGKVLARGEEAAVVESVKAASEIYAPVSGEVVEVNEALEEKPALVNASPLEEGWFLKLKVEDARELDALMDEDAYQEYVSGLD